MRSAGFQRFVAGFVGCLLLAAVVMCILTGDESMIGTTFAVGGFYAVYLVLFLRKEKERRSNQTKKPESPLLRR